MKNRNRMFIPEDANSEALMLMGRVEALAAYVNLKPDSIEGEAIAAILGFDLDSEAGSEVPAEKKQADREAERNEPLPL